MESIYEYGTDRLSYYDGEENNLYAYTYSGDGSVSELTGTTSDDVVNYSYDPYGIVSVDGQTNNQYDYNAEYTDYLTGNQYLRARYYDPDTGSFTTSDTYSGDPYEPLSQNRYTYAGNDPVNTDDPSGHGWLKKQIKKAKKAVKKVQKKVVKKVQKVVKKAKKVVEKAKKVVKQAKKYVKKKAKAAKKKVKKLYKKAKKAAKKVAKKVCTTTKRIAKTATTFVKSLNVKKIVVGVAVIAAAAVITVATGGAALPILTGALIASGSGAVISGAATALAGGSIKDIAEAVSEGFMWGAISGAAGGAVSVAASGAASAAIKAGADTVVDTGIDVAQSIENGDKVNLKSVVANAGINLLTAGTGNSSVNNEFIDSGEDALKREVKDEATEKAVKRAGRTTINGVGNSVATNTGKVIDTTPSSNHTTVKQNPGLQGKPNSSVDIIGKKGELNTRRWFDQDGNQVRDVDMTNHGNPKKHPEVPHEHGPR